jgi:hypothetical protein
MIVKLIKPVIRIPTICNADNDQQEYKWEMEVYLENYELCFTPNGMCADLDVCKIIY